MQFFHINCKVIIQLKSCLIDLFAQSLHINELFHKRQGEWPVLFCQSLNSLNLILEGRCFRACDRFEGFGTICLDCDSDPGIPFWDKIE